MLDYGHLDHGASVRARRLGREDQVRRDPAARAAAPLEEIDPALREICAKWGYLDAEVPLDSGA